MLRMFTAGSDACVQDWEGPFRNLKRLSVLCFHDTQTRAGNPAIRDIHTMGQTYMASRRRAHARRLYKLHSYR